MRVAVLLALAAGLALSAAEGLQDDPAEDLIRKLGSESIDERTTAARMLGELGESARPALQRASKSSDIETSRRASVLLRVLDLRGRLSPAIREQFPNVEERLSNGADSEWTAVFLQASRGGLPTADLVVLAPAAFRGARTPEETISVCDVVRSRVIRSALPDLLKLLQKPDQGVARQAARCVTALDGPELRRGLLAILEGTGTPAVRMRACDVLLDLDAREALPSLLKLFDDPEAELRRKGLAVLVRFEAKDRASAAVALLKDQDNRVRAEAVLTLRRLDARDVIPAAIALLADPSPGTRQAAVHALDSLKAADAIPALAKLLEDPDSDVRAAAVWALGSLGGSERAPRLRKLLEDEESSVRAGAVWALARAKVRDAAPDILLLLKDPDADVRALAAWAVGTLEYRDAAPHLIRALTDASSETRKSVARAAGRLGLKEAVPALLKLLESETPEAEEAAGALGRIGAPEAIPLLLTPCAPGKKAVGLGGMRPGAYEALRAYPAADVLPHALALLSGKDPKRRAIGAEALRAIRSPASKEALLGLLAAEEPDDVQAPAARALGELGAREAIPRLVAILEDEGSDARADAAYALSLLGAKEALPTLRRGVQEGDRHTEGDFVRALERYGDDASRDFVIAGLPEYRDEGIYAAAMWLCREGRKVAIRPLLDDGEVYVPLNALRRPQEWKKLRATRLAGDLDGSLPELAERIAVAAGLTLDWQSETLEPDLKALLATYRILNHDGRLTADEALLALVRLMDSDYEVVLEPGRLRVIPWDEAWEFWERWGERALKEKE